MRLSKVQKNNKNFLNGKFYKKINKMSLMKFFKINSK
jgi:hypothetical protein